MFRKLKNLFQRSQKKQQIEEKSSEMKKLNNLSKKLIENLELLKKTMDKSGDFNIREIEFGKKNEIKGAIIFIDGLVEKTLINENIMKPLMLDVLKTDSELLTEKKYLFAELKESILTVSEVSEIKSLNQVLETILSGDTALLINGYQVGLKIGTRGWESRSVQEPQTEVAVRGPREGFTENLRTNTSLLRRRIKSPDLILEAMKIGNVTKTDICIGYLRGIVNQEILDELRSRLEKINIDGILESGYIEELIEDEPFSIFATVGNTEKPDIVAGKILEGRVVIITDGTPIALTLPYLFLESLQSSEDYYSRPWLVTLIRMIRFFALIATVFLPAVYVAAQTYHTEMLPTSLLITMAADRQGVPFPVFVEITLLGVFFEVLREAGVRLPRPIGQAVSIVGALVLGEAAVNAGLVSNPSVLVTAMAGIAAFIIPSQNDSLTIIRLSFTVLSAISGFFGILIGVLFILTHMVSLRSFGVPYLSPLAPGSFRDLKDIFIRVPIWMMETRPRSLRTNDQVRQQSDSQPKPSKKDE